MRLKDIATVSNGVSFRSRVPASLAGKVRLVQMKDLGKDELVHLDKAVRVDLPSLKSAYRMRAGDIFLRARGQTFTAAMLDHEADDAAAAAPLLRVRASTEKVLPSYLLWWINQPNSQKYLSATAMGSSIKMVSVQDLKELKVTLPPLKQQARIAKIHRLACREQQLMKEIRKRKRLHTQGVLMRTVSEFADT